TRYTNLGIESARSKSARRNTIPLAETMALTLLLRLCLYLHFLFILIILIIRRKYALPRVRNPGEPQTFKLSTPPLVLEQQQSILRSPIICVCTDGKPFEPGTKL
ncbi:hypothetical protein BGZ99_003144, partial [Dissophora globulifera]